MNKNYKKINLRELRKFINIELIPFWFDSEYRTKLIQKNYDFIFNSFITIFQKNEKYSTLRMIFYEMLQSLAMHQLQSFLILYRSFICSYCKEVLNLSKTQSSIRLGTFEKAVNELFIIFEKENHFLRGVNQFNEYIEYEIKLIENNKNLNNLEKNKAIRHLKNQIKNKKDAEINSKGLEKQTRETIKFCNKIAHAEINFKKNNDENSIKLNENSLNVFMNIIGMMNNFEEYVNK
ncbi:hypothetical protein [Candidatus Hepatoplasma crinochetorum]|uniref:hypothetical protein n=1 Tax=Candidatus Hepatoplasma crinochetorum TaxID=295596 RepID=UPI003089AD61|nr:MAG: hypothetical protein HCTKY_3520 [Candidatus Hepatoplasma crinochetorum]